MALAKANAMLKELGVYLDEQLFYIALPGANGATYVWPWIKNYEGEIMAQYVAGSGAFKYAWVDQNLKKSMGY